MQVSVALNPKFGIWSPTLEMMVSKQWFLMDTYKRESLNHPIVSFQLNNTFDTKWVTVSILMSAQTEGNMGNKFVRRGYFNTDMSIYKSLLNNQLTLQFYVSDLFGTADACYIFHSGPNRSTYYKSYSSSSVNFTIRYQFNVTNSKYKGTSAGKAQRSRM